MLEPKQSNGSLYYLHIQTVGQLQEVVNAYYTRIFGVTPRKPRLIDIAEECHELCNYKDEDNLREELGDLLTSLIQFANENDFNIIDLVQENIDKITQIPIAVNKKQ